MKPKMKKQIPYDFIFDELEGTDYYTKPMFGATAVYVGHKIMLILYKKEVSNTDQLKNDMGIWVCIPDEYTLEMKAEFPQLKGVSFFENENSAWQCLRETEEDFEELALRFCKLIKKGDPRIGRIPKPKKKKTEQVNAKKAKKKSNLRAALKKRKEFS